MLLMQFAHYRFSPRWYITALTIIAIAIFLALTLWQWHRAEYKQQLAEQIMQQNAQSPLNLNQAEIPWPDSRFRTATVTGQWEAEGEILLDNSVHRGRAGYYVITPLRLAKRETRLLVNRGWIPTGNDRRQLPRVDKPNEIIRLNGVLDNPRAKPFTLTDLKADLEGNQRWLFLSTDYYSQVMPFSVYPYILLQTSTSPDGLKRDWSPYENKAGMHIGYAIQWAAFALIVLIAYLKMNLHRIESSNKPTVNEITPNE